MSRLATRIALLLAVLAVVVVGVPVPATASGYALLVGSGSTWSAPAIDQWSADVHNQGIVIDYSPSGSAAGRNDYMDGAVDFAGSDIAFLNGQDKISGGQVESSQYAYSYLPITAGGLAFMYHLTLGGQRVTNLRLSGDTLAKIFTGQITNWSDPQITRDYGAQLPDEPITPVVRADPAGETYMFSSWLNAEYPKYWNALCQAQVGVPPPCGASERFPAPSTFKQADGSTAVSSAITSSTGEGTIGYVEYAYALAANYPVIKLLNPAGYYVLPTASNVAIALQRAQIDFNKHSKTYLMQNLQQLYSYKDPRSYPLSSYSYLVVPSTEKWLGSINSSFTSDKGKTLSTWANYFLCQGQQEAEPLGYSPLPRNLVRGGIVQVNRIPGGIPGLNPNNLQSCNNPTMQNGHNILLENAPYPSRCDKLGAPLYGCNPATGSGQTNSATPTTSEPTTASGPATQPANGSTSSRGAAASPTESAPAGARGGASSHNRRSSDESQSTNVLGAAPSPGTGASPSGGLSTDPDTGNVVGQDGQGSSLGAAAAVGPPPQAVLVEPHRGQTWLFSALTAIELGAAVTIPPLLGGWLARRRRTGQPR